MPQNTQDVTKVKPMLFLPFPQPQRGGNDCCVRGGRIRKFYQHEDTRDPVAGDEVTVETKGLIWEGLEFQGKRLGFGLRGFGNDSRSLSS